MNLGDSFDWLVNFKASVFPQVLLWVDKEQLPYRTGGGQDQGNRSRGNGAAETPDTSHPGSVIHTVLSNMVKSTPPSVKIVSSLCPPKCPALSASSLGHTLHDGLLPWSTCSVSVFECTPRHNGDSVSSLPLFLSFSPNHSQKGNPSNYTSVAGPSDGPGSQERSRASPRQRALPLSGKRS